MKLFLEKNISLILKKNYFLNFYIESKVKNILFIVKLKKNL